MITSYVNPKSRYEYDGVDHFAYVVDPQNVCVYRALFSHRFITESGRHELIGSWPENLVAFSEPNDAMDYRNLLSITEEAAQFWVMLNLAIDTQLLKLPAKLTVCGDFDWMLDLGYGYDLIRVSLSYSYYSKKMSVFNVALAPKTPYKASLIENLLWHKLNYHFNLKPKK